MQYCQTQHALMLATKGQTQIIDPDANAIRKIPDSPKDIIQLVMQARRRQDPRTAMEFHGIFKPNVLMNARKILKTR
jgi:hypothetical protein